MKEGRVLHRNTELVSKRQTFKHTHNRNDIKNNWKTLQTFPSEFSRFTLMIKVFAA